MIIGIIGSGVVLILIIGIIVGGVVLILIIIFPVFRGSGGGGLFNNSGEGSYSIVTRFVAVVIR
jgi:hypothetical protein